MLDKKLSLKIYNYLDLIRFKKPIGFFLLMWPCWFALSLLPIYGLFLLKWYLLFFVGAFLMRSAGCIVNDIVDIDLDKKVKRTRERPLTSKKILIKESIFFLIIFLFLSLIILLQFNLKTILIGLLSLPLIVIYPFMKRYTYFPQIILGLTFSWGVIIVSFEFFNKLNLDYILLYIGCIFWTLSYDTIYAYQDRDDDIKNNIKSTAVFFGNKGRMMVKIFYLVFLIIIGYLNWKTNQNLYSLIVILLFIFVMNILLNKWKIKSKKSSNYFFKLNNIFGLLCFLFLLVF